MSDFEDYGDYFSTESGSLVSTDSDNISFGWGDFIGHHDSSDTSVTSDF